MKQTIFKSILILSGLLLAASISVQAQSNKSYPTAFNGGTNNVAATATNSYSVTQNVSEFDNVGVIVSFKATAANTGTVVLRAAKTADANVGYETTPSLSVSGAANGTNTVILFAAFDVKGASAIKFTVVENPGAAPLTNIVVSVRPKATKVYSVPSVQ